MKENLEYIKNPSTESAVGLSNTVGTLTGDCKRIKFKRVFAVPSEWTFTIMPIARLLHKYSVGVGWVDPFAGENSPAEYTNDINPERKAKFHLDAEEFLLMLDGIYEGILFDPPYSYRQVSEHYKAVGREVKAADEELKQIAKRLSALAGMPYCWEDILDRLYHGYQLPFKFEK